MAAIEKGTFVNIVSGNTWVGYSDGEEVALSLTKKGKLPRNANHDRLYHWYKYNGKVAVSRGYVARYEASTEEVANPMRQRIRELRQQLSTAQEELAKLYDYQAGPEPTDT